MDMMTLTGYETTVLSWGAVTLLLLIQVIVVDVVGLRAKHLPGAPVEADHGNLLFRTTRTVANTNESIAIYILVMLFCVFSGADAQYTGLLSWGYVASRAAYALCYYFNIQMMRSVCFGLSLIALLGLLITGFIS